MDPSSIGLASLGLSYERAYQACHVLVAHQGQGEAIYDILKVAIQRCAASTLRNVLREDNLGSVQWLKSLVDKWQWFEDKLVRRIGSAYELQ